MNGNGGFWVVQIRANIMDYCGICGKYIDLCLPHSYNSNINRTIHRECDQ